MTTSTEVPSISSTIDPRVLKSISLHEKNLVPTILHISFATVAFLSNLAIMAIIMATPLRQKRYFRFCFHLAIADMLVGLSYIYVSIHRFRVIAGGRGEVQPITYCLADVVPMTFAITSSNVFAAVVSLDRLLAMLLPVRHRSLGLWYDAALIGLAWLYNSVDVCFVYITMDRSKTSTMCTNVSVYDAAYATWSTWSRVTWTGLGVVFCCLAMFLIWKKVRGSGGQGAAAVKSSGADQELFESIKTISIVVAVALTMVVTSRIGYLILQGLAPTERSKFGPSLRVLQLINSAANLYIYLWRSTAFKKAVMRRKRGVAPSTTT